MLIDYLKNEFDTRSKKNPQYSLRAFARALRIDSSTLSALLRGKRVLTLKTAKSILAELELDEDAKARILMATVRPQNEKCSDNFEKIDEATLEFIQGWEHYAIFSILGLKNFPGTVNAISSRLNLGTGVVISALNRMNKIGLVRRDKNRWYGTDKTITMQSGLPSAVLRRANREYIERALYSLEQHGPDERHISGITMAVSKKQLKEAFARIDAFRQELHKLMSKGEKDEVYRLNVQLFPLKK